MYVNVRHSFILSRTYTYNWLRDYTSWASSGIGVKIKSVLKNFWSLVLNFTALRCTLLFLYSETYITHVINCEWSRSVNFPLHMYLSNGNDMLTLLALCHPFGSPFLFVSLHACLLLMHESLCLLVSSSVIPTTSCGFTPVLDTRNLESLLGILPDGTCVVHIRIQWNYGHPIQTYICPLKIFPFCLITFSFIPSCA